VFGRPAPAREEDPVAEQQAHPEALADEHVAERRHRASVAPEDVAHYVCSCGFQFQASVSTSVSCPHCGTGQAW
jgi:rubrerythrin